jgi:hypothetical protein
MSICWVARSCGLPGGRNILPPDGENVSPEINIYPQVHTALHQHLHCLGISRLIQKLSRYCHAGGNGKSSYNSYSVLTSTLDEVSGQRHAPAAIYPWKRTPRYPLYRRLGGPQSRAGQRLEEKSFASAGDRIPVAQSFSL